MNSEPTFKEWLSDRNITFIIISILVIYALERFAKNMHTDVFLPLVNKCTSSLGCDPEKPHMGSKVVSHVIELTIMIIILFVLSKFAFKHGRVSTVAPVFSVPSSNPQIVPLTPTCDD